MLKKGNDMEKYKLNVIRECTQTVTDVYTIYAENKNEAKEFATKIVEDPELLVTTPHDTIEDSESRVYKDEFYANITDCIGNEIYPYI